MQSIDEQAQLLRRRTVAVEARMAAPDTVIDGLRKQDVDRIGLIEIEYAQALLCAELDWLSAMTERRSPAAACGGGRHDRHGQRHMNA